MKKIIIIVLILTCLSINKISSQKLNKNILILHSYHQVNPWSDKVTKGLLDTLYNVENLEIFMEYMNTKRKNSKRYLNLLYNKYKLFYAKKRFDVLICVDDNAFNFAVKYHKELFNNSPIIFCGVSGFDKSILKKNKNITGVIEILNIKKTIDLALKLHFKIKNVVILIDNTNTGRIIKKLCEKILNKYKKVNIKYIDSKFLTTGQAKEKIKKLNKNDILLYTTWFKDKTGQYYSWKNISPIFARLSKAPMYGLVAAYLGRGIVGGKLLAGYNHGKLAGQMAKKILNGIKPYQIKIIKEKSNKYMFDYNRLKIYGIPLSSLPKNSIVINKPVNFYKKHKLRIITLILIFSILAIIIIILAVNIFKRKQIEKQLKESKERLKLALHGANMGLFDWNLKTDEIIFNETWEEFLGYSLEKTGQTGKIWKQIIHPDDYASFKQMLNLHLENKRDYFECEHRVKTNKKTWVWLLSIGKVVDYDKDKNNARLTGLSLDITLRKHSDIDRERLISELEEAIENEKSTREELQFAYNKAEESNRLKTEFLAIISHELRTPLSGMLGFSQLLEMDQTLSEKQREFSHYIFNAGQRLLYVLNDLLEISIIEAGNLEIKFNEFDVKSILDDVYILLKNEIKTKNIDFNIDIKNIDTIYSDASRVRQFLFNIIGNAVKFTEKGKVTVEISKDSKDYVFKIEDTGIGIDKKDQDIIFDKFRQVESHLRRNYQGVGLGLAISKRLIEALNGQLWVNSELGKGSSFFVKIPIIKKKKDEKEKFSFIKLDKEETTKKNVLYAEDDNINFQLIKKIFDNKSNFISKGFYNGAELLKEFKNNDKYDLIILDIQMPIMDGVKCLQEIREINKKIPIIALTAFSLEDDKEKYLNMGFTDYISKPIDVDEFVAIIENT